MSWSLRANLFYNKRREGSRLRGGGVSPSGTRLSNRKTPTITDTRWKLQTLAAFLRSYVQDEWFDLISWSTEGFPEQECGTTACAVGWATQCPEFAGMGLSLVPFDDDSGRRKTLELRYDEPITTDEGPGTETCSSTSAAMAFFGIDSETVDYLFLPETYPQDACGRLDVAARLDEIAAEPNCCVTAEMDEEAKDDCENAGGSAE